MTLVEVLVLGNLIATLVMVGVIWFVQIVHYPLFAKVSREAFQAYEAAHTQWTTYVVLPPMLLEAMAAVGLVILGPSEVSRGLAWAGLVLVAINWLSTFLVQVPCHNQLMKQFEPSVHQRLVMTNWIRTIAWSLHSVVIVLIVWQLRK